MRDIVVVIDEMLDLVPNDELELRDHLRALQTTARYMAPEMQRGVWESGAVILADRFGPVPPEDGWKADIIGIFRGERTP